MKGRTLLPTAAILSLAVFFAVSEFSFTTICFLGSEHARESFNRTAPSSEQKEGQPLCCCSRLWAKQHPCEGYCESHRWTSFGTYQRHGSKVWRLLCNWKEVNILIYVICQGREGEIRHIFRGFAFLHCKKLVENGGMFVCKARHLVLAGGSKVGLFYTCEQI